MTYSEAIAHFGTQTKLAEALGMTQGSVSAWEGFIPPLRQIQLQTITGGKLMADPQAFVPSPRQAAA